MRMKINAHLPIPADLKAEYPLSSQILKLKEKGTPIISEIEFAGRYTDAKMICITGSNGKTTTTSLIYHIFKSAGLNVGLAGNIGNSLEVMESMDVLKGHGLPTRQYV